MQRLRAAAPGLRDVLLTGKAVEVVRRRDKKASDMYDAVILDAPPTGRIAKFLNVNSEISGLAWYDARTASSNFTVSGKAMATAEGAADCMAGWMQGRVSWEALRRSPNVLFVPSQALPAAPAVQARYRPRTSRSS
mgnify:CR=1 FL=1